MYTFKEFKDFVSVYKGETFCAMIDTEFAQKQGYETAIDYCKKVFGGEE